MSYQYPPSTIQITQISDFQVLSTLTGQIRELYWTLHRLRDSEQVHMRRTRLKRL